MSGFTVIIPARLGSTRLPAKAIADIEGVPMVCRVAQAAAKSGAKQVLVACDHTRIVHACEAHGVRALMTSTRHPSGTDRVLEAASALGLGQDEVIINVQGDEPRIPGEAIAALAARMERLSLDRATLMQRIEDASELTNPNVVKVVVSRDAKALYFSRSPIPFARNSPAASFSYFRHIGIYGYRLAALEDYVSLPRSDLEAIEALEQLRLLENGRSLHVFEAPVPVPAGVDTEEDLAVVRRAFA